MNLVTKSTITRSAFITIDLLSLCFTFTVVFTKNHRGRTINTGWIKPANTNILKKKRTGKEGYGAIVKAVEIGTRGFVAGTQYQFLSQIEIKGHNRAKCMKHFLKITQNSFMWKWNKK